MLTESTPLSLAFEPEHGGADDVMAYEKLKFSLNQVDKAGKALSNDDSDLADFEAGLDVLWNYRVSHSYPLNAFYMTLGNRSTKIDEDAVVVRRLKRFDSVMRKLRRRPTMQLSQMQDIGGCRAIMSDVAALNKLYNQYKGSPLRHAVAPPQDYVTNPKEDGYRSIHLRYRFNGNATSSAWDKLRIELQLRTNLQHAWATAVETVDTFTGEDLKFGQGSSNLRRFFALMGSVHALVEGTSLVPGTPTNVDDLRREVRELESQLGLVGSLRSYAHLTKAITGNRRGNNYWYIIQTLPALRQVKMQSYSISELRGANQEYSEIEQKFRGTKNQVVLVSARSITEIQKAYPNYFADTE